MVMATNPQAAPTAAPHSGSAPNAAPNSASVPAVNPQSVGREFVRQYYTLLNKAPKQLHRFYCDDSSFVHGGVDPDGNPEEPVFGQQAIHDKILGLSFCDCHAKIRQVDSHVTVGDGVVVQVTGELSNNGEPMRRFMQTFVLAPQTPKNYYVRNDIFRYQDEVFNESDSESENGSPSVSDVETEETRPEPVAIQEPPPATVVAVQDPTVTSYYEPQPTPVSNGTAHLESPETTPVKQEPEIEELPREPQVIIEDEPEPVMENHEPEPEIEKPPPEEPVDKGPKVFSWADRARQGGGAVGTVAAVPPPSKPQVMQPPPSSVVKTSPESHGMVMTQMTSGPPGMRNTESLPQREPRRDRGERRDRGAGRRLVDSSERDRGDDRNRSSRFPDSHQLFVGNLPQDINDEELKNFFNQYGNVVEMRINRNTAGPKTPFFGFIVFDKPDPVQELLVLKKRQHILLRGEHRLNVEEKKARGGMEQRPRGRGSDTRPGSGGPPRGGMSSRGGGGRGGPGGLGSKGGGGGRGYNPQR
ncbi:ras GTPase-activating protein-binding protein 2-like [Amphiura filiformis]|uniref:ras GTPase-activating protein-binding protein 2-like n=1 Tax=Amphiura filiformis TaxID=82378 RepID=UPI003B20FCBC